MAKKKTKVTPEALKARVLEAVWDVIVDLAHDGDSAQLKWYKLRDRLAEELHYVNGDELVEALKQQFPLPLQKFTVHLDLSDRDRRKILESVSGSCLSETVKAQVASTLSPATNGVKR